MANSLSKGFIAHIETVANRLHGMAEETASTELHPDGWSAKQVIGHLIDSALNNHQRFVRAALDGDYVGPGYAQNAWVEIHGYQELSWQAVVAHWKLQNDLLGRVVERIPEARLSASCQVGNGSPVTLKFLIEDYLTHMDHHIAQIADRSEG